MPGQLYVVWLGTGPIKHVGKCLRHAPILLKITYYNNNTHFQSLKFQFLPLRGFDIAQLFFFMCLQV